MTNNPTSTAPYPPEVMAAARRLAAEDMAHIGYTAAMFRHLPAPLLPGAIGATLDAEDRPLWAALWPIPSEGDHAVLVAMTVSRLTPLPGFAEKPLARARVAYLAAEKVRLDRLAVLPALAAELAANLSTAQALIRLAACYLTAQFGLDPAYLRAWHGPTSTLKDVHHDR